MNLSFHTFPKDVLVKKKWIVAIKRDEGPEFRVTKLTVVCSDHFVDSDYATGKRQGGTSGPSRSSKTLRRLRKNAVLSVFTFRPVPKCRRKPTVHVDEVTSNSPLYGPPTYQTWLEEELHITKDLLDKELSKVLELKTQVLSYVNLVEQERLLKVSGKKGMSDLEFYSGFNNEEFIQCFNFLQPQYIQSLEQSSRDSCSVCVRRSGAGPKYLLNLEDQFLLVLIRLRLGLLEKDLAIRFCVGEATVSRTFVRWINYMYLRLGLLPVWPSSESIQRYMPFVFKEAYPTTFCIMDVTEIFCELPASLSLQSQCYFSYKSHTTMKGLLAVAPNGAIIFVSELFTGSISDRQLTMQSGFLEMLKSVPHGRSVMADKGFDIQDLLVKHGLLLNIPPFKGSTALQFSDVQKTQTIARVRIHVERVIGQVKRRYRILQSVIPLSTAGSIYQIWSVCCMLTNFRKKIINEDHD